MTFVDVLAWCGRILRYELFHVAGAPITLVSLLTAMVIMFGATRVSRIVQAGITRTLDRRGLEDPGTRALLARATHYIFMAVGFAIALQALGFDLASLFAAGAIFAVGIGFAMQNIAQNFVSGIILMIERTIRPGDVLRIEGRLVAVEHMGIRATVVRTLDDEQLIVPNSTLVQSTVTNFTYQDRRVRIRAKVGVHYDSDLALVNRVLAQTGAAFPGRVMDRGPSVQLKDFGASSVDWEVSIWIEDPLELEPTASRLRLAIWDALKEAGIVIAYPQLDVHFDTDAVERLRPAG